MRTISLLVLCLLGRFKCLTSPFLITTNITIITLQIGEKPFWQLLPHFIEKVVFCMSPAISKFKSLHMLFHVKFSTTETVKSTKTWLTYNTCLLGKWTWSHTLRRRYNTKNYHHKERRQYEDQGRCCRSG